MANCIKSKPDSILFFGDSITELGVKPNGYVTLIRSELNSQFPKRNIEIIGAGISGQKVPDLEARLNSDVLSKQPDIVAIYIGINDVWRSILPGHTGTSAEDFEAGLHRIIKQLKAINADVVLCRPSIIGEKNDNSNPLDQQLDQYTEISRNVASEENLMLIDLRREFKSYLSINNSANAEKGILTYDGVYLSDRGNKFVADVMLKQLINIIR
ncbi:MAG: SGNH/GDSL hydrolase family protein [Candidatus Marinimicrobia bacterium]|nr:SGNH/GDSL hydrolase family protein [Candidatus Neomarinimicrobiota bacterium]